MLGLALTLKATEKVSAFSVNGILLLQWEPLWSMLFLKVGGGLGDFPVFISQSARVGRTEFPWIQAIELLGDGAMVYTDTDPHGPARKIATDLLSHWPHIFIVSGKGRPAYQEANNTAVAC